MTKTKAERVQDVIDGMEAYFDSIDASDSYRYGYIRASYRYALEDAEAELLIMENILIALKGAG